MKPIIPFSSKIQKRHETLTKRRYFYPALFLDFVLWILVAITIFAANPDTTVAKVLFFCLFSLALFLFLALIFDNSRRGFLATLAVTVFLFLRVLGVGTLVNALLLIAIIIAVEMYLKSP